MSDHFSRLYQQIRLIGIRGRVGVYSARRANTGEPRLLFLPKPGANYVALGYCFRRIAQAHGAAAGGSIPRVAEYGELDGVPYLGFACDVVATLEDVVDQLAAQKRPIRYAEAMAFLTDLMTSLRRVHAFHERDTDRPLCLGTISWWNVFVSPSGQYWVVGFGHNLMTHDEHGGLLSQAGTFQAPEVAAGDPPTPGGDLFAVVLWARSFMPYVELPAAVERIFKGRPEPEDEPLIPLVTWATNHVVVAPPEQRPTVDEAIANYARGWKLLGVRPSLGDLRQLLADAVGGLRLDTSPPPPERQLIIGPDCDWVSLDGGSPISIRTRRSLRRITMALARSAVDEPGRTLDVSELLAEGWPGEQPLPDAGANRVYVAISTLRKLGLKHALQRSAEGYRIDPRFTVRFAERPSRAVV